MGRRIKLRHVPPRLTTGAYILHSGLEKWRGDENTAGYIHAIAGGAIPPIRQIPAPTFLKVLAGAEIALGTALLNPLIPTRAVGLGLTAFSGSLLTMYARTPSLHKPGSIWPSQQGIGVSKDVWMAGLACRSWWTRERAGGTTRRNTSRTTATDARGRSKKLIA